MAKNIDVLADRLGAERVAELPPFSGGAFGAAALVARLRSRLSSARESEAERRELEESRTLHPEIPMTPQTEERLRELARWVSSEDRPVSTPQIAAELLEKVTESYFRRSAASSMTPESGMGKKRAGSTSSR